MRLAAVASLLLVLAACSNGGATPAAKPLFSKLYNLRLDVRLSGAGNVRGDPSICVGTGQYADIAAGANVVITNQDKTPIASGKVTYGVGTDYYHSVLDECVFRVIVYGVPKAKWYAISIGRQPGKPFTRAGLVATKGVFSYDQNAPNIPYPVLPKFPTTTTKKKG